MNLSSSARSVVVGAAVAATAGFGLGAAFTSHSTSAAGSEPARQMVGSSTSSYERSHPTRLTAEMRRKLAATVSQGQADATTWRRADGTVHEVTGASSSVRILPHDVKGP
ncbi:MAG TPA: hypothetical protein VIB11_17025 [Pedococcus sp.]|jgi:hypothetical protein|uniref:hypothetical protein n=1 Tax=Pedococcus sp. TaxID=2860345 RepID=UPI002F92716A